MTSPMFHSLLAVSDNEDDIVRVVMMYVNEPDFVEQLMGAMTSFKYLTEELARVIPGAREELDSMNRRMALAREVNGEG